MTYKSPIIVISTLIFLCGCASTTKERPSIPERTSIKTVVVGEIASTVTQAGFGVPTSEEEGRRLGLEGGIVYGLLFIPSWIVGGPITMGPLASAGFASCGSEISSTNAVSKLNEIATDVGINDFKNGLNTELQKILLSKHGAIVSDITRTEGEYVLEISKLAFSLEAKISDNFKGCGNPHFSIEVSCMHVNFCRNRLQAPGAFQPEGIWLSRYSSSDMNSGHIAAMYAMSRLCEPLHYLLQAPAGH